MESLVISNALFGISIIGSIGIMGLLVYREKSIVGFGQRFFVGKFKGSNEKLFRLSQSLLLIAVPYIFHNLNIQGLMNLSCSIMALGLLLVFSDVLDVFRDNSFYKVENKETKLMLTTLIIIDISSMMIKCYLIYIMIKTTYFFISSDIHILFSDIITRYIEFLA